METERLYVVRQDALEREMLYHNGAQQNVHSIIKNNPFQMELGLRDASDALNLHANAVVAQLLYDVEGEERPVGFVKAAPMEYYCQVNDAGSEVLLDIKLSVLSSQHEDMFFLIKFSLTGHPEITTYSDPIRVVSKPAQLKSQKNTLRRGTKRSFNDTLKESLARIEQQQREQQSALSTLMQSVAGLQKPKKKARIERAAESDSEEHPADRLKAHLLGLVDAFHELPAEQRPEAVRKLVRNSSAAVVERLSEVLDALLVEGLQKEIGHNVDTGSPYEALFDLDLGASNKDMDATLVSGGNTSDIDAFYKELLSPLEGDYTV